MKDQTKILYAAEYKARIQQHKIANAVNKLNHQVNELHQKAIASSTSEAIVNQIKKFTSSEVSYASGMREILKSHSYNVSLSLQEYNKTTEILSTTLIRQFEFKADNIRIPESLSQISRKDQVRLDEDQTLKWGTSDLTYKIGSLTMSYIGLSNIVNGTLPHLTDIFGDNSPICQHVPITQDVFEKLDHNMQNSPFVTPIETGAKISLLHSGFTWSGHRGQEYKDFGPHDASSFVKDIIFGNNPKYKDLAHSTRDLYFAYLYLNGQGQLVDEAKADWKDCLDGVTLREIYTIIDSSEAQPGDIRIVMNGVSEADPLASKTPGGSIGIVHQKLPTSTKILECNRDQPSIEGVGIGELPDVQDGKRVCYMRLKDEYAAEFLAYKLEQSHTQEWSNNIESFLSFIPEDEGVDIAQYSTHAADEYVKSVGGVEHL